MKNSISYDVSISANEHRIEGIYAIQYQLDIASMEEIINYSLPDVIGQLSAIAIRRGWEKWKTIIDREQFQVDDSYRIFVILIRPV